MSDTTEPNDPVQPQGSSKASKYSNAQKVAAKARSIKAKGRIKSKFDQAAADYNTARHLGLSREARELKIKAVVEESDGAENTKIVREIEVPMGYPETEEIWREDVATFLRIAVWKASRKLATSNGEGIESVKSDYIATPMGICMDKLNVLMGQPTHISLQSIVKIDHTGLREKLAQANTTVITTTVEGDYKDDSKPNKSDQVSSDIPKTD